MKLVDQGQQAGDGPEPQHGRDRQFGVLGRGKGVRSHQGAAETGGEGQRTRAPSLPEVGKINLLIPISICRAGTRDGTTEQTIRRIPKSMLSCLAGASAWGQGRVSEQTNKQTEKQHI